MLEHTNLKQLVLEAPSLYHHLESLHARFHSTTEVETLQDLLDISYLTTTALQDVKRFSVLGGEINLRLVEVLTKVTSTFSETQTEDFFI